MPKLTKAQCEELVDEIIGLQDAADRYKEIEKLLKENLGRFADNGVATNKGRAFVSISERVEVPVEVAREILGPVLAKKIIEIKESVINKRVEALVDTGDINDEQHRQMLELAKRKPITSLYIRPLK